MKKGRVVIVVIVVLVIAAAVVWRTYFQKKGEEGVLLLSGNMEVTETNVGFKLAGRVTELAVDEGDHVQKDQRLAGLDDAELASLVSQSRAALQEALSRLAELQNGSRPQEIEEARANVGSQEAELTRLGKDFERADKLFKNGAISNAEFDAAKSAYETRIEMRKNASEALSLVKEGPRKESIAAAVHQVEQAKAALRTAEDRLKDTIIYAPGSGVILRKNVELGETVATGTPIYTIGDLSSPWIKVYVPEAELGLVKLGQKAQVSCDAYPGKTYDGWVSYISSEAEFTPKNVQTQEERVKLVYGVKVRVNNPDQDLKPSMPADVRIQLTGLSAPSSGKAATRRRGCPGLPAQPRFAQLMGLSAPSTSKARGASPLNLASFGLPPGSAPPRRGSADVRIQLTGLSAPSTSKARGASPLDLASLGLPPGSAPATRRRGCPGLPVRPRFAQLMGFSTSSTGRAGWSLPVRPRFAQLMGFSTSSTGRAGWSLPARPRFAQLMGFSTPSTSKARGASPPDLASLGLPPGSAPPRRGSADLKILLR
jgi:HlyD family secretion protein